MQIFKAPNFNFIKWRWHALVLSTLVVLAGAALMVARGGLPFGIDFSGGTQVIVKFAQPVSQGMVLEAIQNIPGEKVVQQYDDPADNSWLIRLPQIEGVEQGASLEQGSNQVVTALQAAGLPKFEVIGTEFVGPVIGADLQRKGIYATLASMVAITLYIAFRFRLSFAVGSITATLHDLFVTLACLVLFNYELSLNIVAALLTMVGYSVNDMIVIFDRVRENARLQRRDSLENMINTSLNQTLGRTVITSGTVFLAVLALYLFGGEVLSGFAFTMLAGTVATTYSGWFIAPSIAIMLGGGKSAPRTPADQTAAPTPQATRPRSKRRNARAS
jgi:preprotein translocase subunit SecF